MYKQTFPGILAQMIPMVWIAWRGARNYGAWHATADNKQTLCGKSPPHLISIWRGAKPPPVEDRCGTCQIVEFREFHQRKAS